MSINKEVIDTIAPIGYPVEYMSYDGSAENYFTFNFETETPSFFGDDAPISERYDLQLHFFCPKSFNHLSLKNQVKNLLFNNGWSYPTTYTLFEDDTKKNHVVFLTAKEMNING